MLLEEFKKRYGDSHKKRHSIYRELVYLTFMSLGRENIDHGKSFFTELNNKSKTAYYSPLLSLGLISWGQIKTNAQISLKMMWREKKKIRLPTKPKPELTETDRCIIVQVPKYEKLKMFVTFKVIQSYPKHFLVATLVNIDNEILKSSNWILKLKSHLLFIIHRCV